MSNKCKLLKTFLLVIVKAFEEFPIRVDAERNTVDIVWREDRSTTSPRGFEATIPPPSPHPSSITTSSSSYYRSNNTLRRERFSFHDVYAGPSAIDKLDTKVRLWTRQALLSGRDLNIICCACGEEASAGLTPPMAMAIGDRGHAGIVPAIVEEAFNFLADVVLKNNPPSRFFTYKSIAKATSSATASRQESLFKLTLGAVMLRDTSIIDMLGK